MSTTLPHLEHHRAAAPDARVDGGSTAIAWPELKLPPINLYNVQKVSTHTLEEPRPSRD